MNILAVDTSGSQLGIGIVCADSRTLERHWDTDNHSSPLFERMREATLELDLAIHEIELLAVVSGPGSFTGLRIGMSGLLGWGIAVNKPVQVVDTFSAVRETIPNEYSPLLVAIHSRKDAFYCSLFDSASPGSREPFVSTPDSLDGFLKHSYVYLGGPGASRLHSTLPARHQCRCRLLGEEFYVPDMLKVCNLAERRYRSSKDSADKHQVEPFYMSPSQAEIKFDSRGSAV
jgi:tRNA threonylcarbamoyladenosine biosynthesis protein TsaB